MKQSQKRLHLELMGVANAHKKYNMKKFNQLNLTTGQPKVLTVLLQKDGYLQKDLAKRCHVEPATMTSLLKIMELRNLIYKQEEHVSGGKRAYSIYLTEYGRDIAHQVEDIVNASENISFEGFSEVEKDQFLDLMDRMKKNIERHNKLEEETLDD